MHETQEKLCCQSRESNRNTMLESYDSQNIHIIKLLK